MRVRDGPDAALIESSQAPALIRALTFISQYIGVFIALAALVILCGWIFDIHILQTPIPGVVPMKANAAACFLFTGLALWLLRTTSTLSPAQKIQRYLGYFLASLTALIGLLVLLEYGFTWDTGLDQLIARETPVSPGTVHPGRMSPFAALNFLVTGLALLLLEVKTRRYHHPSIYLILIVGLTGLTAIIGYIYGASEFVGSPPYTPLALDATFGFLLLFIGVLLARPTAATVVLVAGGYSGSLFIRFLIPGLIVLVILTGWLRLNGESRGYFSTELGVALFSLINIAIATTLIFMASMRLYTTEQRRRRAELEIRALNANLEQQVTERTGDLRKSEEKYRLIFENAEEGIFQSTPQGKYISVNPAFARIGGYGSPEEMINSVTDIQKEMYVNSEDRTRLIELLASQGTVNGYEFEIKRHDGAKRWVSINVRAVRDPAGKINYLEGTLVDITERKQAEESLKKSEENYRLLAAYSNQLNDISMLITGASDTKELFSRIAESFRLLTGAIAATFAVYGQQTGDLKIASLSIDPANRDKVDSIFGPELLEMRIPVSADDLGQMHSQAIRRPADLCELSNGIMPQDISGAIMSAIGCRQIVALAITFAGEVIGTCVAYLPENVDVVPNEALKTFISMVALAVKRKQGEERLRRFYESGLIGVISWNMNGQITDANDKFLEMIGYNRDDLANGRIDWVNMTPPEYQQLEDDSIAELKARGVNKNPAEKEYIRKDGTRIPIVMAGATLDEERFNGVAFVLDITDRKRAEQALRNSEEKYRSLFDNAEIGMYRSKIDGSGVLAINDKLCKIIGYSREEILSNPATIRWAKAAVFYEMRQLIIEQGVVTDYEFDLINKSGEIRTCLGSTKYYPQEGYFEGSVEDITERKQAEEKLRESERMYHLLADHMVDTVWLMDMDLNTTYISPSVEKLRGYTLPELRELPLEEQLTPVSFQVAANAFLQEMAKIKTDPAYDDVLTLELEFYRKDGTSFWSENTFSVVRDDQGKPVSILGEGRDITERRKAEESLRSYAIFLNNMVEQSPTPTWISDDKGTLIKVNMSLCELLRATEEELVGKYNIFNDNIVEEQGYMPLVRNVFEKGEVARFELYYDSSLLKGLPLDKTTALILDVTIFPIRDAGGRITNAAIQHVNLTDRRKAEVALLEAEQRYRTVADFTYAWEFWQSPEGKLIYVSPSCERITGYTAAQFLNNEHLMDQIILPEDSELYMKHFSKANLDPADTFTFRVKRKDGEIRWIEHVCRPVINENGEYLGIRGSNRDVTDRMQAQEEILEKTMELERSNTELERFAYVASHDLQEPLRTISSYLQLLERRYKERLDEKGLQYMDFTVRAANRLQNMISGLLEYSRVETRGQPFGPVNCETVLRQTLENLRKAIDESNAQVTYSPLPTVPADRQQLVRLFQNLLANSIRYRGQEPPRIHVSAEQQKGDWVFAVQDNGIGIDPEYKDQIFVIFQSLHGRDVPGIGLGLSVAKRIVERHGGRIWVESRPGEGATFYFTIPDKSIPPRGNSEKADGGTV
jgi:PAS domain S-box-containing protein